MSWRLCDALVTLRDQVDDDWPDRSRHADGTIGDPAHAAQGRASDHNPWVVDPRGTGGVVTALDITHDPAHGVDCWALATAIAASHDTRVKYLIHRRTMWRSYPHDGVQSWAPAAYHGADPHTGHLHVSVQPDPRLYDDTHPWPLPPAGDDVTPAELRDAIRDVLHAELPDMLRDGVLGARYREYVDQDGNRRRDERTVADILYSTHAHVLATEAQVRALRTPGDG